MNILCLGGSRFLGPVLINNLLRRGHQITVINRGTSPIIYEKPVQWIQADRDCVMPKLGFYDVVIDTCAYQRRQLEVLFTKVECDLFIFVSTVAVYQKSGFFPLLEDHSPLGDWPIFGEYNRGRVGCEIFLAKNSAKYASVRPVYILGPNNYLPREAFIYNRLINGLPIILPGDGQAIIQFVFVDEVAESIIQIAEKKAQGAYNCVGHEMITLRSFVERMGDIAGVKPEILFNAKANGLFHQPEEFPFANESFICSNQKVKKLGVEFHPLLKRLQHDFETYYQSYANV